MTAWGAEISIRTSPDALTAGGYGIGDRVKLNWAPQDACLFPAR